MTESIEHYGIGSSKHIDECWDIKEEILDEQGLLKQGKKFYSDTFVRSDSYVIKDGEDTVLGFALISGKNYLALLGVRPEYQGNGLGTRLIEHLKSEYDVIYCHTRESNKDAIDFYKSNNFFVDDIEGRYYEDGENAYILRYDSEDYSSSSSSS